MVISNFENQKGIQLENWNIPDGNNVHALITVAHPDDETIFCGGTMLYYPTWQWTIVCFTGIENSVRFEQFQNAMEYLRDLGVRIILYLTLNQEDVDRKPTQEEFLAWKSAFQRQKFPADIVFTHNVDGEYGHSDHKTVNRIIHQLYLNIWEFICPGAINVNPQPYKGKVNEVPLSFEILAQKREVFNRCYTSERYLWDNLSDVMMYEFVTGPEIFTSD